MKKKGLIIIAAILLAVAVLCVISYYTRGNDEMTEVTTTVSAAEENTTAPALTEKDKTEVVPQTTYSQTVAYTINDDSIEITVLGGESNNTAGDKNEPKTELNEPSGNKIVIE